MGFALTLLYLGITYIGAETVFGALAAYHVEVVIAALAIIVSIPTLQRTFIFRTPQSIALVGLAIAVFISIAITGWLGGALSAFQIFIPSAFAYFLICVHCNSKRKLQVLVVLLISVCVFDTVRGIIDLERVENLTNPNQKTGPISDYLYGQHNDSGEWIYRIKGQGLVNDPNDFAQLIAATLPLIFIFWRRKRIIPNLFSVILPAGVLLFGAFLTHSRGFVLAFLAMLTMAGRRRIGTIPSLIVAGSLFAAATAFNFTGGRDISADAGSGRMALWGGGIGLLKSHLLFGVGYGRLPDFLDLTAHNSIVACAAELGIFGFYFWCLFLSPTVRDAFTLASPGEVSEGEPIPSEPPPSRPGAPFGAIQKVKLEELDKSEANHLGELALLSWTGFLVAGFFLSRGLVLTFFLLGGITEVFYQMALQRKMVPPRLKFGRVLVYSGIVSVLLLVFVEVVIHVAMPR